jgi:hypothetical protein
MAVKPTTVKTTLADGASLTDAYVLKVVSETAPLRELGAKLIDLRKLLAQSPEAASNSDAQAVLDKVAASIDAADANLAESADSALTLLRDALRADVADGADLLTLIDDAIREVERAERERILGRAGGDIALGERDIPVIREAQARLLDEARRLGLLVDHDPAKAFEALRG